MSASDCSPSSFRPIPSLL